MNHDETGPRNEAVAVGREERERPWEKVAENLSLEAQVSELQFTGAFSDTRCRGRGFLRVRRGGQELSRLWCLRPWR